MSSAIAYFPAARERLGKDDARQRMVALWRYTVHPSPVSRMLCVGVSRGGKVVHRTRTTQQGVQWALDQIAAWYERNRECGLADDAAAARVLREHGRL